MKHTFEFRAIGEIEVICLQKFRVAGKVSVNLRNGSVPERPKGTGCKPVGASLRWFDSNPAHLPSLSSEDNEFFIYGRLAQLVEQLTLNQRVTGSSPVSPIRHSLMSNFAHQP
jgi:hypothetical protein